METNNHSEDWVTEKVVDICDDSNQTMSQDNSTESAQNLHELDSRLVRNSVQILARLDVIESHLIGGKKTLCEQQASKIREQKE